MKVDRAVYESVLSAKQVALAEKKQLRDAITDALDNWDHKEIAVTILTEALIATKPKPVERPKDCGCT
jgi:hypothetical protein